jgi:hypothetical protein
MYGKMETCKNAIRMESSGISTKVIGILKVDIIDFNDIYHFLK